MQAEIRTQSNNSNNNSTKHMGYCLRKDIILHMYMGVMIQTYMPSWVSKWLPSWNFEIIITNALHTSYLQRVNYSWYSHVNDNHTHLFCYMSEIMKNIKLSYSVSSLAKFPTVKKNYKIRFIDEMPFLKYWLSTIFSFICISKHKLGQLKLIFHNGLGSAMI